MKKKFQLILSISMFVVLLTGFAVHTFFTYKHVYGELVDQVIKDNRVIGEAVIKLLTENKAGQSKEELIASLRTICNDILLPNKGYICAIGPEGYLLAAPGYDGETPVDMGDIRLSYLEDNKTVVFRELKKNAGFEGTAEFPKPFHTDIVATMPIADFGIRLMVHQNKDIIRDRAFKQVKPLILVGAAAALLLGGLTFFMSNRLVHRYENKLETLNRELIETNRQLSDADRHRQEFLHILSHDLTHPLGSIINVSEKLCPASNSKSPEVDPGTLREYSKMIHTSASHGLGVIQLVRGMQDLEDRKFNLELKPVDVRNMAEMAFRILERRFYKKKIQFINNIPENLKVRAETYSLCNTVFTNLFSNAVKFSPRNSQVKIAAEREDRWVKLTITDSGIGIPPGILEELFDINPHNLRPGTEGETGTGCGMPLVKRLVEVYGGSISVESRQKENNSEPEHAQCGTTVTLLLDTA
jgi:signal transduction histidine kinase